MATYKQYHKNYKILMLKYAEERMAACRRNIYTFETMLRIAHWSIEIQSEYLIKICQERDLLHYLQARTSNV